MTLEQVTPAVLVDQLDQQVRAVVRRDGVDPQRETDRVRALAAAAVAAHDEASLTGAVVPVADPAALVDELVARVAGFGPLQRYLDDPEVEEIWINDPSRVFVARGGRHELTTTILTADEVRDLVERMLKPSGRRLDVSTSRHRSSTPGSRTGTGCTSSWRGSARISRR